MRYEKPECVLLGEAGAVVLGGDFIPQGETLNSNPQVGLMGYDE